jgi:hypothetical protein
MQLTDDEWKFLVRQMNSVPGFKETIALALARIGGGFEPVSILNMTLFGRPALVFMSGDPTSKPEYAN